MNAFFEHHKSSIEFGYRCFDRLLLNGLIQPFQQPERVLGFFNAYRNGTRVTRSYLTGIADQFQNWVTNRSEKWGAPIPEDLEGSGDDARRDKFVLNYFQNAKPDQVVAILKAREPARILIAIGGKDNDSPHLEYKQRWIKQYNFYVNDAQWGRMFVRVCPYFPFSARVCLNQHHWLATFTPFFSDRERRELGCQHRLFFSQVEYCDNLIFRRRAALDEMTQRLLDANRTIGQPKKITMIFGRKVTKQYKGKLQTEIEDLDLPNPVIRSHYGHGFAKQYVRDGRILRTEPATNNVYDYRVNKGVENLPALQQAMSGIVDNYQNVQQDILETFVDRGQLRELAEPTVLANGKRIPGLKLDHPRQLALMHALVRFSNVAGGGTFRTADLYAPTLEAPGCSESQYSLASLRYDLSKLRAKKLVERVPKTRRYRLIGKGYSICVVLLKLFERIYAPLTAGLLKPFPGDRQLPDEKRTQLDRLYQSVKDDLDQLLKAVGLKIAA